MPLLVHITDQKNAASILRSGIKLGKYSRFVYFMPISSDYSVSYQWGRELKRQGIKNYAAVHFRLPDDELVWSGKYNKGHTQLPLSEAIGRFLKSEDLMGYEFYLERKVPQKEIVRVRNLTRPIGWRYSPDVKGRTPCYCPACGTIGEPNSAKARKEWEAINEPPPMSIPDAKEIISNSKDTNALCEAVQAFGDKRRKSDPSFLFPLLDLNDEFLEYETLKAIGTHAHPKTRELLEKYTTNDEDTKELVEELLVKRGWGKTTVRSTDHSLP
ncbi:hypothetical protein VDG1235_4002 [Verrucomicrobiia bacterium DG1235]|nr:hypothetical protein VDG1235_4002 [Verrucomicrobiae bacterium DG1235]